MRFERGGNYNIRPRGELVSAAHFPQVNEGGGLSAGGVVFEVFYIEGAMTLIIQL